MAAFNSNVYAARALGVTAPHVPVSGRDYQGKPHICVCSSTGSPAWAQDDTLNLIRLPAGSRVLAVRPLHGALGASVTLSVTGNDGSNRTFVAAYDASVASTGATYRGSAYIAPLAADTDLVITLAGGDPTNGVAITTIIEYITFQA